MPAAAPVATAGAAAEDCSRRSSEPDYRRMDLHVCEEVERRVICIKVECMVPLRSGMRQW
jgi:hypothetical protein